MGEHDWYIEMPGHSGFYAGATAAAAKRTALLKVCEDFRKNNGYSKTRSERRYLLNRTMAWRVR